MSAPTSYVIGFMFGANHRSVALIKKLRPEWQAGKLNGIGGKIEPNEHPDTAMSREFFEEAGILAKDWRLFCTMVLPEGGCVHCYETTGDLIQLSSRTDEEVIVADSKNLEHMYVVPNLRWLVPMARDRQTKACTVMI